MQKVLILGSTGMLGSACTQVLKANPEMKVFTTNRDGSESSIKFDVKKDEIESVITEIQPDYIINCIGVIKPHIDVNDKIKVFNAIDINSMFPFKLQESAEKYNAKIIQIATDCVYSGAQGNYLEDNPHDPHDVYGKTKSLGEVISENFLNLRCSIIGPEVGRVTSLLEWFRSQPKNAKLNGFIDHVWNGVTTHAFASVVDGIFMNGDFFSGTHHLVPSDTVSKFELLELFKKYYSRSDIEISNSKSEATINRTLNTNNLNTNRRLWKNSKFGTIPTIEKMIEEQSNQIC